MPPDNSTAAASERHSLRPLAGWLLFIMLVLSVLRQPGSDVLIWVSGAAAWAAALILWPRIGKKQRAQVLIIIGFGIVLATAGALRGAAVSLEQALGQNQVILAMLAAVSFLKLVNRPIVEGERIPVGKAAFARTLLGLHLFGAAINITAVVIVADRLAAQARFERLHAMMIARGFCLSVMYSPFIGGMALALSLTPGSRLEYLAAIGLPLSAIGLLVTYLLLSRREPETVSSFKGYPIHVGSLWLPALLAACVIVVHRIHPALSVLTLISILAPVLVAVVLVAQRGGRQAARRIDDHIRRTLPDMSGELLLFLSAGVLAAGLTSLFASFGDWTPFDAFNADAASITLCVIVSLSIVGIHPIVCVSFFASLLAPLEPDPNLLALVFVTGWAIGCTLSPFSGTNLTMQGRYGVNSWSITTGNLGYGAIMVAASCAVFYLVYP